MNSYMVTVQNSDEKIFRGSNSTILLFPSQWGSSLKEKNMLFYEPILSFKSRPHFERTSLSKEASRLSQNLCPSL